MHVSLFAMENSKALISCPHFIPVKLLVEEDLVLEGKCEACVLCWLLEGTTQEWALHQNLKVLVSCSHFILVIVLVEEGSVLVGKCRAYVSCWFLEGMVSERMLHPFLRSRNQAFWSFFSNLSSFVWWLAVGLFVKFGESFWGLLFASDYLCTMWFCWADSAHYLSYHGWLILWGACPFGGNLTVVGLDSGWWSMGVFGAGSETGRGGQFGWFREMGRKLISQH